MLSHLIFFLVLFQFSNGISLQSASFQYYDVNVLANQYVFSYYSIDFDEDVFRTISVPCVPYCQVEDYECPPCDYTLSGDKCLSQYQEMDLAKNCSFCTSNTTQSYCSEEDSLLLIAEIGKPFDFKLYGRESIDVFIFNPNPCTALRISFIQDTGDTQFYIFSMLTEEEVLVLSKEAEGPEDGILCPSVSYGTLLISIYSERPSLGYFIISKIEITSKKYEVVPIFNAESYIFLPDVSYQIKNISKEITTIYFPLQLLDGCYDYLFVFDPPVSHQYSLYDIEDPDFLLFFDGSECEEHFSFCLEDYYPVNETEPILYLEVNFIDPLPNQLMAHYISSKTKPELFSLVKVSDYTVYSTPYYLMGDTQLTCFDNGTARVEFCTGQKDLECFWFCPIASSNPPAIFWPIPSVASTRSSKFKGLWDNEEFWIPPIFDETNNINNTLSYYLLMSYNQDQRIRNFYEFDQLSECFLSFLRPPKNSKGEFIRERHIYFEQKQQKCNYTQLVGFVNVALRFFEDMTLAVAQELTNTRFELDVWMMSSIIVDCYTYHENILSYSDEIDREVISDLCIANYYRDEFYEDPCCDSYLQWVYSCAPRNYTTQDLEYEPNKGVTKTCKNPNCVSDVSLPDFYSLRRAQKDLDHGCRSIPPDAFSFFRVGFEPFKDCMTEHLSFRKKCNQDSDCRDGRCDFLSFTCLISPENREKHFLECLFIKMDPFIKETISIESNLTSSATLNEIYEAFSDVDCVGKYDVKVEGRTLYYLDVTLDCDFVNIWEPYYTMKCLDKSCWVPYEVDYREYCYREFLTEEGSEELCLSESFCNWDQSIICSPENDTCIESCLFPFGETKYFCGWCEDGENCLELSDVLSEEDCLQIDLCFHPNGTIMRDISEEECSQLFGCDQKCHDPVGWEFYDCQSKEECSTLGGRCVLHDYIPTEQFSNWDFYLLSNSFLLELFEGTEDYQKGVCWLFEMDYSLGDSCLLFDDNFLYIQRGTNIGCVIYTPNSTVCDEYKGIWIDKYASSEQECKEIYGKACRQNYTSFNYDLDFLNIPKINLKDEYECSLIDAKWGDKMNWISGNWISSQSRKPQWIQRQYKSKREMKTTLNFFKLRSSIERALDLQLGYSVKTEAYCLHRRLLDVTPLSVCDCTESEESSCFTGQDSTLFTGIAVICYGITTEAIFPPYIVTFSPDSIPFGSSCNDIYMYSTTSVLLKEPEKGSTISTSLFSFETTTDYEYSFKNSHNSFVGQVLSDGAEIRINPSITSFKNVTICTSLRDDIEINSKYKVYDFAILVNFQNSRLDPLEVVIDQSLSVDGVLRQCGYLSEYFSNKTYFPVIRMKDWEDEDSSKWSDGELFGGYLLAILYLSVCIISLIELGFHSRIKTKNVTRKRQRYLMIILSIFSVLRSSYFFLLMGRDVNDIDNSVDYFLIEIVTILFFSSFITYLLFMWVQVIWSATTWGKHLPKILIITNLIIYIMFGVMMVAYDSAESEKDVYYCGRFMGTTSDNSSQDSIKLAYRIVMASVAFIIGISFLIVGISLYSTLLRITSNRGVSSARELRIRLVLLNMSTTISISFILQSIFFLVVELMEINSMAFTVPVLIVVELLPCYIILYTLRPRKSDMKPSTYGSHVKVSVANSALSSSNNKTDTI